MVTVKRGDILRVHVGTATYQALVTDVRSNRVFVIIDPESDAPLETFYHVEDVNEAGGEVAMLYYHADEKGIKPGFSTTVTPDPYDGREYTYATTNLDAARAFALQSKGHKVKEPRSVYLVELDAPIVWDPDFLQDLGSWFVMSSGGTVIDVVDEEVTMTIDEAHKVMSRYARWVDKSPIYDADGYPNVPPRWRDDHRFDEKDVDRIKHELRTIGQFPPPPLIVELANRVAIKLL
jgi:hypothetical protein